MNKYYMTDDDFNKFLNEIGGLNNGFYPDRDPIMSRGFFAIGNGWLGLIKELIEQLIELDWNKQTCQVKEKFGGLRFYVNELCDEGHTLIEEAESNSYNICEKCGAPGEPSNEGWIRTLCETCKNKK